MCAFGVLWLSCEAPAARSGLAAGVPHDNQRAPKCTFERHGLQNTTKIQLEDLPEREERKKFPAGEKKKAKFWAVQGKGGPAEGGPGERPKNREHTHHTHTQTTTTNRHHQQAPTGTNRHQQAPGTNKQQQATTRNNNNNNKNNDNNNNRKISPKH